MQELSSERRLQAAGLIHQSCFNWHKALWQKQLCQATGVQGPLLLHGAVRSQLAVDVVQGAATPIKHHQAKAVQLQLLVRHLSRSAHSLTCLHPLLSGIVSSIRALSGQY